MDTPLPNADQLVIDPSESEDYLAKMGVRVSDLYEAIQAGELAAANLDTNHPVTAVGLERWLHSVGHLRKSLSRSGLWDRSDPSNRPVSRHLDRRWTISLIGGNDVTGLGNHPGGPKAARAKGKATGEAAQTLPLFSLEDASSASDDPGEPPSGNWFVLYYRGEDHVRLEVSLPSGFEDGQFTGWVVRVVLEPWYPQKVSTQPLDIGGQDVDFRVEEVG